MTDKEKRAFGGILNDKGGSTADKPYIRGISEEVMAAFTECTGAGLSAEEAQAVQDIVMKIQEKCHPSTCDGQCQGMTDDPECVKHFGLPLDELHISDEVEVRDITRKEIEGLYAGRELELCMVGADIASRNERNRYNGLMCDSSHVISKWTKFMEAASLYEREKARHIAQRATNDWRRYWED